MDNPSTLSTQRYQIAQQIGAGGIGAVYQAFDRLSGQYVALKQIIIEPEQSDTGEQINLLELAHEFSLLAGLRHPHIISVLDYGFDAQRQPFFTMELLEQAESILEFGARAPLAQRIELLIQAIEALAYLHRRGVLHHDLKPENILVVAGHAYLLDFGLAVLAHQQRSDDAFGTLQYLAPEVVDGAPYTSASDLYSLGVITYELLLGRHPFEANTVRMFLAKVRIEPPDLTVLADQPALAVVLEQLLHKQPHMRPSAQAAITLLRQAIGSPVASDAPAIRESYLQAASFVGREAELAQLRQALDQACQGMPSIWLVGGESGGGKSRLLDELRVQALVQGVQVVRGQAVAEGGSPFQLWRELVRHLALNTPLSHLEASVLKEITPDLERLCGHSIADAPSLEGSARQQRLAITLASLLKRQRQPTLVLLEDLQWSQESLEPLRLLAAEITHEPLLIIGSYRTDERPTLPSELPTSVLQLSVARLDDRATKQLVGAMLGDVGQQPALVAQIYHETEGNIFFLVELLRAWAEEAGGLGKIGQATLPQHILTGGITEVVRRRLAKVPVNYQPLLLLAAIAGREIDLTVLAQLGAGVQLQAWLHSCSEAMVLQVHEQRWRFTHDKLREVLLRDAVPEVLAAGHAQVAQAIEAAYADTRPFALALAEHWRAAGNMAKEIAYSIPASEQLLWVGNYTEAEQYIWRVLGEYANELPTLIKEQLLKLLGDTYRELDRYPESIAMLRQGLELARQRGYQPAIVALLNSLGWSLWRGLQYEGRLGDKDAWIEVEQCHSEAYALAEPLGDLIGMAHSLHNQGIIALYKDAAFDRASAFYQRALALFQAANDQAGVVMALLDGGEALALLGNYAQAKAQWQTALALTQQIRNPSPLPYLLDLLVDVTLAEGDWQGVELYVPEFLQRTRDPQSFFYMISRYAGAVLAFHQRNYALVHTYDSRDTELAPHHQRYHWLLTCTCAAAALLQNTPEVVVECLRTCIADLAARSTPDQSYFWLLAAGHWLAQGEIARGATWLGLHEATAQVTTSFIDKLDTHLAEVSARIRERFANELATPVAQAALAAGAQIAPERVLAAIGELTTAGELSVERILRAVVF